MFNELCNLAIMLSVCYIVSPSIVLFICGPKVYNRLPLSELLAVLDTYTYSETSFGPVDVRLNRFFKSVLSSRRVLCYNTSHNCVTHCVNNTSHCVNNTETLCEQGLPRATPITQLSRVGSVEFPTTINLCNCGNNTFRKRQPTILAAELCVTQIFVITCVSHV